MRDYAEIDLSLKPDDSAANGGFDAVLRHGAVGDMSRTLSDTALSSLRQRRGGGGLLPRVPGDGTDPA